MFLYQGSRQTHQTQLETSQCFSLKWYQSTRGSKIAINRLFTNWLEECLNDTTKDHRYQWMPFNGMATQEELVNIYEPNTIISSSLDWNHCPYNTQYQDIWYTLWLSSFNKMPSKHHVHIYIKKSFLKKTARLDYFFLNYTFSCLQQLILENICPVWLLGKCSKTSTLIWMQRDSPMGNIVLWKQAKLSKHL